MRPEPPTLHPWSFAFLEANVKRNVRRVPVTLRSLALSRKAGRCAMSPVTMGERAKNYAGARATLGEGNIPVSTLDAEVSGPVGLVKIDVEGHEAEVLAGAIETLRRCQPHLFVEVLNGEGLSDIYNVIAPVGYRAPARFGKTWVYHFAPKPARPDPQRRGG